MDALDQTLDAASKTDRSQENKIRPNPPTQMVSIALMRMPYKQFDDRTNELMREKIDIVSHARHHIYTRTKKERRVIRWGNEREEKIG